MAMVLNKASEAKLKGVHPDMVRVVRRVVKDWKEADLGFVITCGVRTLEEQKRLLASGASKTMRSRHLVAPNGYSHAIDIAMVLDGKVRWDWPLYDKAAKAFKAAAKAEKVPLEWGGDWPKFRDGPHFQLPWATHSGK